jgi:Ca-activated chloride channel family protein
MGLSTRLALIPCLLASAAPLKAQEPGSEKTQSPYFVVLGADAASEALPLKSTTARVEIAGVIASVKVTQIYTNTGSRPLEAVYVFPGSTRAAVHGLTMTLGERVIRAQIQEKDKARAGYEAAKQEGRSATLLEQHRPNVFQMNVANLLPGDEIKVELDYTELLVPVDGVYSFVYPTVVGPRYTGAQGAAPSTGEAWTANPTTPAGVAPASDFDLKLRLDAGMPIDALSCGTHKHTVAFEGANRAELALDPSESKGGNRDLIVKYRLMGDRIQSGLLLHRGEKENFFLLMAQPPKRVEPADMPPREYVFIMDVSGSQMGFPIEISKKLMNEMIEGLRPQDRFNVMVFEGGSALWREESQPADFWNRFWARRFIASHDGGGGTNLGSALERALKLPGIPGVSRTFVVSTDGFIGADASIFDLIRKNLGSANLFAFGIGRSVNRLLIEGMAHAGQGEPFVITSPEQAPAVAARFRAYVSTPVLSQVKLTADGFDIYDVEPAQLPDVLSERPVICYGKWRGAPKGTLVVAGSTGAGPWRQEFHADGLQADGSNAALRHLWARQRLQLLSDYNQFGETPERRAEITQLGLAYGLLTAHTAFLAVDTFVRNPGNPLLQVRQPLPMPQGVPDSAMGSVSNLAPGAAQATVVVTGTPSSRADTTVAVCASTAAFERLDTQASVKRAARQPRKQAPLLVLGTLKADRPDVPLTRVTGLIEARLRILGRTSLPRRLPARLTLIIEVDASGGVTKVVFEQDPGPAGRELEAVVRGWRFGAWPTPGSTVLRVPLEVRK